MIKKPNYYSRVLHTLQKLHTAYPQYNMGRHLSTALSDYGDVWNMTDREIAYALAKYKAQLEMDFPHDDVEIDKILQDGMDLDDMFKEEEEDGY